MRTLITSLALAALAAAPLLGQSKPQTRDGFTVSFGLGAGTAGATCDQCDTDRQTAPSGYLRLGGALRPNLVLAGEVNAWSRTESQPSVDITLTIVTVNALVQWYPQPTGGFFVSAGAGSGAMALEVKLPQGKLSNNTNGFGYQVGTGYDIRLGKNFSLSPFATYFGTAGGKVEGSGAKVDANVFHIGLGFTWH